MKRANMDKYRTKFYMNEEKGAFLEHIEGEELDTLLTTEARKKLNYAFYEVCLEVSIDPETGEIEIHSATET